MTYQQIILNMIKDIQNIKNEMRAETRIPGMPRYVNDIADRLENVTDNYTNQTVKLMLDDEK